MNARISAINAITTRTGITFFFISNPFLNVVFKISSTKMSDDVDTYQDYSIVVLQIQIDKRKLINNGILDRKEYKKMKSEYVTLLLQRARNSIKDNIILDNKKKWYI